MTSLLRYLQHFLWLMFFLFLTAIWLLIACELTAFLTGDFKLGVNLSDSAVHGIYQLKDLPKRIRLGDQVSLQPPYRPWMESRHYWKQNQLLIKTVAGLPGEYLTTRDHDIVICDAVATACRNLGRCLDQDSAGRSIPCMEWHHKIIPYGYYYVSSQRVPDALDSRYFGLIPIENLNHQVRLLWGF